MQNPVEGSMFGLGSADWPKVANNPPECPQCSAGSSIWLQMRRKEGGISRLL